MFAKSAAKSARQLKDINREYCRNAKNDVLSSA